MAKEPAAFAADNVITGCRFSLHKKVFPPRTAYEKPRSGSFLRHHKIDNDNGEMLIGHATTEIFFTFGSCRTRTSKTILVPGLQLVAEPRDHGDDVESKSKPGGKLVFRESFPCLQRRL